MFVLVPYGVELSDDVFIVRTSLTGVSWTEKYNSVQGKLNVVYLGVNFEGIIYFGR